MRSPVGKIGASQTGVIGETCYEYLRGKSWWKLDAAVRGSVQILESPRRRLASRHVVAGPCLANCRSASIYGSGAAAVFVPGRHSRE